MYQVPEDMKLSKNFTLREFACKDGSKEITVDYKLVQLLQKLRDALGKPITVTSGYRTVIYNKRCGGISTSHHLTGKASDLIVAGKTPLEVARWADEVGFKGIGVYPTFTHVDVVGSVTGKKLYWRTDKSGKQTFYKSLDEMK